MNNEIQPTSETTLKDSLVRAAALKYNQSFIDGTKPAQREYDRLAFIYIAFLLSDTPYNATYPYRDVLAGMRYAAHQYAVAIGEPLPMEADLQERRELRRIAATSFDFSPTFTPIDNVEIARAILNQDESRVQFKPLGHDYPFGHADDVASRLGLDDKPLVQS